MSANLIQLFDSLQEIPEEFLKATPLLDLQALPRSALNNKEFEAMYANSIQTFNKIQTQVFQALYTLDKNDFIGASMGSGKRICVEFALMRIWSISEGAKLGFLDDWDESRWRRKATSHSFFRFSILLRLGFPVSAGDGFCQIGQHLIQQQLQVGTVLFFPMSPQPRSHVGLPFPAHYFFPSIFIGLLLSTS